MSENQETQVSIDEMLGRKVETPSTNQSQVTIENIPLNRIDSFPNHPYLVNDDEEMAQLVESVREQGVVSPAIVRLKDNGRYELISGHRRKRASELAELATMPAIVGEFTAEQAAVLMVDSNCQRERILPSEKAFAYKIKMEALSKQGKRTDLTSTPLVAKSRTGDEVGKSNGDSREQVRRYIRLTYLISEFRNMVDEGQMAFRPAVEISYLLKKEQKVLYDEMKREVCTPSLSQAVKLKNFSKEGVLTPETTASIMSQQKPNQAEQVRIPKEHISQFFKEDDTPATIAETIVKALELYRKKERQRSGEAR